MRHMQHSVILDLWQGEDGNFDVYSAGGLGNNARFGLKVAEKCTTREDSLLYLCNERNIHRTWKL